MTTQADTPPIASNPSTPLGVDPVATPAVTAPVAKEPTATEPPASVPRGKQLTQEEYDALQLKARNYELIEADPELAPKILDHFRAKTGRIGQRTTENTNPAVNNQMSNEVEERMVAMAKRQAQLEIDLFKQRNPDMDNYRQDMVRLINKYPGMELEDAYRFSKGAQSQPEQKPVQAKPVTPTTETNQSSGETETDSIDVSEYEKRINDPKATPHMDDVIAAAWAAAKQKVGQ